MKYILSILLSLVLFSAKAQFTGTDSLRNYNNRYITNNPATAFTNLRLNTLLRGMIDYIDTARAGTGGGGALGVDTLWALNDSTVRYRKNGVFRNMVLRGVYDTRRKVDSMYKVNDTTIGFKINGTARTIIIPGRAGANHANAALTANADYTQNWAQHILKYDSTKYVEFNSYRPDPLLVAGNIYTSKLYLDSTVNGRPFSLSWALRNGANDGDSIRGVLETNESTTSILNSGDNNNQFGNWQFIGNSTNPRLTGTLVSGAESSSYSFGRVATINPFDSVRIKLESTSATAKIMGVRAESSGLWTPVAIDVPTSGINQLTGDVTAGPGNGSQAATIANNTVSNAKLAQAAALTIKGNPTNATANVQDITAASDGDVLRRSGTAIGFGTIPGASVVLPSTQIAYGNGTITSEAAFNYNATTNKLSVDSITTIKINTDSLRIAKSPILADDTLLTRKANGNVGKLWNIGVSHLDNGTSATKNTAWYGNGKWESNGVHTFFKVDEGSFPADGDSIYSNSSLAGYQHYLIFRDPHAQYQDTLDGIEIDTATGTITFHPPLVSNERVQIIADKLQPLRGQPFVQFNVNTVPNVRAWFDATDAPTVTIATGVSQWDDKTPNNNDLTSATGANQPAYFATGGSGNQSFIRFNSTDFLNHTFATPDSAAITAYMVMKQATYTNTYTIYQFNSVAGAAGLIPSQNTDMATSPTYWGYGNYDGVGQNGANLNTGYGEWQLVKAVFRGGNENYVTKNKEGAMMYSVSPEGIGAGSPTTLKNEQILFQYAYDSWDISEAIIIKGEPSLTNDNNIKSYLTSKYQIPAKKSLLMFGDSHTQGIESGTTTGRGYFLTTAKDQGYDVMNMGISGTVAYPIGSFGGITNKNLSDIYTQFDQYIAPNDSYVIFQYGTNDGTSPVNSAWVTSYKASIQHFLDAGVPASKIIICSPPYTTSPTYGTNVANAVPVIAGIATDLGIQYCDFYTYLQGLSLDCYTVAGGDGIHGDLAIHNAMATLLKTFLP
jgi:hypothetical protein